MNREKKLVAMRQWYSLNREKILEKYHLVVKCVTCASCQRTIKDRNMRFHLESNYHKKRIEFLEEQRLNNDMPTLSEFFKYRTIKPCHTPSQKLSPVASLNTDDTHLANNPSLAT